jgi:aarF domain-containing kinase
MLVRANPTNPKQTQVVLLDHGLYRELDNSFRRDYCRLWQGIALGNAIQIEQHCRNMHAGGLYTLLAAMITQRPWDDIVSDDMSR